MTFLNFTCSGWGANNHSFSYDLMMKNEEFFVRISSDKRNISGGIEGNHIQLPLGNMSIVIRIKNRFKQYVDYDVAEIEVYVYVIDLD